MEWVARALRKEDREPFVELMDSARRFWSEHSNATYPIGFEQMFMIMALALQLRISQLENKLNGALQKEGGELNLG